jgi:hypothetical protein
MMTRIDTARVIRNVLVSLLSLALIAASLSSCVLFVDSADGAAIREKESSLLVSFLLGTSLANDRLPAILGESSDAYASATGPVSFDHAEHYGPLVAYDAVWTETAYTANTSLSGSYSDSAANVTLEVFASRVPQSLQTTYRYSETDLDPLTSGNETASAGVPDVESTLLLGYMATGELVLRRDDIKWEPYSDGTGWSTGFTVYEGSLTGKITLTGGRITTIACDLEYRTFVDADAEHSSYALKTEILSGSILATYADGTTVAVPAR